MEQVMAPALAMKEVEKWLDFKKVSLKKREEYENNIESLAEAISMGDVVLEADTHVLIQKLKFPLGKDGTVKELKFQPRLDVDTLHINLEGLKATNGDGRLLAHVCALTGQTKGVCKKLDTEDYGLSKGIASFFL